MFAICVLVFKISFLKCIKTKGVAIRFATQSVIRFKCLSPKLCTLKAIRISNNRERFILNFALFLQVEHYYTINSQWKCYFTVCFGGNCYVLRLQDHLIPYVKLNSTQESENLLPLVKLACLYHIYHVPFGYICFLRAMLMADKQTFNENGIKIDFQWSTASFWMSSQGYSRSACFLRVAGLLCALVHVWVSLSCCAWAAGAWGVNCQ